MTLVLGASDNLFAVLENALSAVSCKPVRCGFAEVRDTLKKGQNPDDNRYVCVFIESSVSITDGRNICRWIEKELPEAHRPICILLNPHTLEGPYLEEASRVGYRVLNVPFFRSSLLETLFAAFQTNGLKNSVDPEIGEHAVQVVQFIGMRILLAEDNKINQIVTRELLSTLGCRVSIAENGLDAFQQYTQEPEAYDLIIMDLQMPVMDGFESTRKIRAWERDHEASIARHVPVVAMSADVLKESIEACGSAGMNGYLSKPVDPDKLEQVLAEYNPRNPSESVDAGSSKPTGAAEQGDVLEDLLLLRTVNVEEGLKRVNNNFSLFQRLLVKFFHNYSDFRANLAQSLRTDRVTARRMVHTLKGVSGMLGMPEVFASAQKVDAALKEQSGTVPEADLEALFTHLARTLRELRTLAEKDPEIPKNPNDSSSMTPVNFKQKTRVLLHLIETHDTAAVQFMEDLIAVNSSPPLNDTLRTLNTLISDYDFEQARDLLQKMIDQHWPDLK